MALAKSKIEQIKQLSMEGHSEHDIAEMVGVSRNSVRKYKHKTGVKIDLEYAQKEQFVQEYEKTKQKIVSKWIDELHEDDRLKQISDKILNLINNEEVLQSELSKPNGMRQLVGAFKIMVDTATRVKELNLKQQKEERESIMQTNDIMNDNFENAVVNWVEKNEDMDIMGLIEPDSIGAMA